MRRINTTNKATDLFGDGKHGWKNGVPGTADRPTEGQAEWFNALQEEIANVIEGSGAQLDPGQDDQLLQAVRSVPLSEIANTTDVSKGDAAVGVKRTTTGAVATSLHAWIERKQLDTYADFGIAPDGADRTAALNALTAALGAAGFRGWLRIPYGTKFELATVYAAVPAGVMLDDESSVNWGQAPTYKNKFRVMYSGDLVSDDAAFVLASGHHPAFMTLNMGTSGSDSGAGRFGTWVHGMGKDVEGDPMLAWMTQKAKHPTANKWRVSWRLQTPYNVAIANPTHWTAGQIVAAGVYRLSDGGKVYKTTAGGACGALAPAGTGTGVSDGGVLWDYVQAALNIDRTALDLDEDGNVGAYGPANVTVTWLQTSGGRGHSISINGTTNDIAWRDISRDRDIVRVSDAAGLQIGTAMSANRVAMSGATPIAPLNGFGKISNAAATNMTSMGRPAGRLQMRVELRFDDANTTLVHSVAQDDQFRLKNGVNVNPPARAYMMFELDVPQSGVWQEVYRSF